MTDKNKFNLIDKNQQPETKVKSCCSPDLTHKHKEHENHNHTGSHDYSHEHAHTHSAEANVNTQVSRFRIDAMDCPTEETLIRNKLGNMKSVSNLEFNLMQRILTVAHEQNAKISIIDAISSLGMTAEPVASFDTRTVIRIDEMDCPTEEALIRKKFSQIAGISDFEFNLMQRTVAFSHDAPALEHALNAINELDFKAEILDATQENTPISQSAKPWWPLALAGVLALSAEVVEWADLLTPWLPAALAVIAILFSGLTTYKKGWIAIANGNLNINALMSIAVTGAFILQQWPEAAMVMCLFAIAERIEAASLDRARNAIHQLLAMTPERATVKQADGSWKEVDIKSVAVGETVRIRPGERVALDGVVTLGQSSIDQAPITGESIPVEKTIGDQVFAGTINQDSELEFRVSVAASGSTLARIIKAVESAQGSRAPTQRFVDQFAKVYTPIVFALSILIAILPPLFFGGDWMEWVYKALVLLVIACPCALVISTPVTIVSGLASGARKGILIKGGAYLEQGHKMKWLALDKTGTITQGKPVQTDFYVINPQEFDPQEYAASLANRSDHPVSKAVSVFASANRVKLHEVENFTALAGRGTSGMINNQLFYLGNHRLIEELNICSPEIEKILNSLEAQGKTTVLLAKESMVIALFGVADTVKESSRQAISELHELGVRTVMLSGDNQQTATAIAKQVGIDEARGNQLPEDKQVAIKTLVDQEIVVGMVGDGINDAPAIAQANIGFAMGAAGADTAIETADVAIMDDDLRKIPSFIKLSRATNSVLIQNITLALVIKAVFLVLTLQGSGTMWMAVFADMGASLLVVFNGLRLLNK